MFCKITNMIFSKKIPLLILLCFGSFGYPEEVSPSIHLPSSSPLEAQETASFTHKKTFLFGSLSIVPGVGVSSRSRTDSKGTAFDIKLGAFPFAFDTTSWIPVITADYNLLFYTKQSEKSPYFSFGLGTAYIIPYVPLRAGFEFKSGFIDLGAKMVLGYLPSPEIRGGITY